MTQYKLSGEIRKIELEKYCQGNSGWGPLPLSCSDFAAIFCQILFLAGPFLQFWNIFTDSCFPITFTWGKLLLSSPYNVLGRKRSLWNTQVFRVSIIIFSHDLFQRIFPRPVSFILDFRVLFSPKVLLSKIVKWSCCND